MLVKSFNSQWILATSEKICRWSLPFLPESSCEGFLPKNGCQYIYISLSSYSDLYYHFFLIFTIIFSDLYYILSFLIFSDLFSSSFRVFPIFLTIIIIIIIINAILSILSIIIITNIMPSLFIIDILPSGNRLHSYGKIHHFSWENPLFLWSFSIAM